MNANTLHIGDRLELRITHLASLGDGVAIHEGIPIFVPYSCAGDVIVAQIERINKDSAHAQLLEIIRPSPDRQPAPCPHFMQCGGCELQHLAPHAYAEFKRSIALRVAEQLGFSEKVVAPLFLAGAGSRRRVELKVAVNKGEVILGFSASRSHTVINTPHCLIADPAIVAAMAEWKTVLQNLKKPSLVKSIHLTVADNGLDVLLQVSGKLKPNDMEALRGFAPTQPIARLVMACENEPPHTLKAGEAVISMGGAEVALPSGSFLQATQASQQALVECVLQHCAGRKAVADIYCGSGTFSLPLAAAGHVVQAYEGSAEAVTALYNATRRRGWENSLGSEVRDLYTNPLTAAELGGFDAVVINPPRNGALPQCRELAKSNVQKVIMVSCNPATFLRDAQALAEGGFSLASLLPVDQFTWSHHLELVGIFERNA